MKCNGATLMLGVLGALLLHCVVNANVASSTPEYPYRGIMDRNIFGLKPPPPQPRPEDIKPLIPDINLTGITTILGNKRVLLKVPAKPPQRPKEEFYILTEGQSEGDIEVLAIDEVAGTVKVNNHGSVQTLDFVNNGIKSAAGPPPPNGPAAANSGLGPPSPAAIGMRQIPPRPLRTGPGTGNEQASSGSSVLNGPSLGSSAGQSEIAMSFNQKGPGFTSTPDYGVTGEEQTLLIEAQRAKLLDEGNAEEASMFPPTDLTPGEGQQLLPQ